MQHGDLVRNFIQVSAELHQRQLWKRFTNRDCFALRIPGEADPLLASVMGAGGEHYGLMLLRGPHAAASFLAAFVNGVPGGEAMDKADLLGFALANFGDMSPPAQAFYRQTGIHPRSDEKVPDFLVKPAHRQGRMPDEAELTLLLKVLHGVLRADRRKLLQPGGIDDEHCVCTIALSGDPADPTVAVTRASLLKTTPEDLSSAVQVSVPEFGKRELLRATWLVGAPLYPGKVQDDDRSLRMLLVAEDVSCMLLHASPFFADQMHECVNLLVEAFCGRLPNFERGIAQRIVFSSRSLFDALSPELRKTGVKCSYKPVIQKLDAIVAEFHEYMDRDEGGMIRRPKPKQSAGGLLPADDDLAGWKEADRALSQRFSKEVRDSDSFRHPRAVKQYFADDDLDFHLQHFRQRCVAMAYTAWVALHYRPRTSSPTLAETLLAQNLPPAQATLLRARMEAHPSIYRVAGHDPHAGTVDLEDVLLGGTVTVHDQLLSENIEDSQFLVLRTFPAGRFHLIELAGPPLGFAMGRDAAEFLRDSGLKFTRDDLKQDAHKLGWLWGWCDEWESKALQHRLVNMDGDPILPHTASFSVADPSATRQNLLSRHDIDFDEQDDVFNWFEDSGTAAEKLGSPVHLGTITFVGDELVLSVNSAKRFETARRWLADLPGVTFHNVTQRSLDFNAKETPLDDRLHTPQPVEITPEIAADVKAIVEDNSMKWLDTPLPILDGKTPREACRTPAGREQVAILIRTMPDPRGPVPVRAPRQKMLRELGLDTEPPRLE